MRVATAVVLAAAIAGLARTAGVEAQEPAFQGGVELVPLSVAVVDARKQYVADLTLEDFRVFDDGVPQTVAFFRRGEVPLALALLLDTSGSMEETLRTARTAAIGFTRQLAPSDVAGLFAFNSTVSIPQDFTRDRDAIEAAILRTTASGATTLYSAVYIALRSLERLPLDAPDGPRRRAIVLVSDGYNNAGTGAFGALGLDDVLDAAARSDTVIYTIGLEPSPIVGYVHRDDGRYVLRELARQTGGRAFFIRPGGDLRDVYRQIHDELSSQYLLAYEWDGPRDGRWHDVTVEVTRPGLTARTRLGYYAPAR